MATNNSDTPAAEPIAASPDVHPATHSNSAEPLAAEPERIAAAASLEHVFKTLNLTHVFYVDDIFEDPPGGDDVAEMLVRARQIDNDGLFSLLPDVPLEEEDYWFEAAMAWWNAADIAERTRVTVGLESITGEMKAVLDYTAPEELESLLPEFVEFTTVGPHEWEEKKEELKLSAPANRFLCLFDVNLGDLSREGRSLSGIDLLAEALNLDGTEEVFFGLFSTNFTIDNELTEWRTLADGDTRLGSFKGRFLPLAKARKDDLVQFAKGLEMMTLNTFCERLKEIGCSALTHATAAAVKRVQTLEVFDFEHIVLDGSYVEGVSEADTLFRLFEIFHRDNAKQGMLANASAQAFNDNVVVAREIRAKRVGGNTHPPHQRLEIRHQELYEGGQLLNGFHSPLRAGDIFRTVEATHWYVLLAPPCNLAVRSNGKRRVQRVTLVPIRLRTETWVQAKRKNVPEFFDSRAVLKYLSWVAPTEGSAPEWMWGVVDFADAAGIEADVLDLATLNPEGLCKLDISVELQPPHQLHLALQKRVQILLNKWKSAHSKLQAHKRRLARLGAGDQQELWKALMPKPADDGIRMTKECLHGTVFDFGLERVLHYRSLYSTYLLSDFTQYISRAATPFDFGRNLGEDDEAEI